MENRFFSMQGTWDSGIENREVKVYILSGGFLNTANQIRAWK